MTAAFHPPISWPLLPLPDDNGELQYPSLEEGVSLARSALEARGEDFPAPDASDKLFSPNKNGG